MRPVNGTLFLRAKQWPKRQRAKTDSAGSGLLHGAVEAVFQLGNDSLIEEDRAMGKLGLHTLANQAPCKENQIFRLEGAWDMH
jgi:hypothetical protein